MSIPDARREAFRILRRVEDAGAFASVLLEHRARELHDPRDVALLTEVVLGVLRRKRVLDHAIAAAAGRPVGAIDAPAATALRVGAYSLLFLDRIPDFAAVDTAVALVKDAGLAKAAGFVNGALRRISRERTSLVPPQPAPPDVDALALFHSHPAWWTKRVVARLGWARAEALLQADNEPAPTVLATSGTRGALRESLAASGVETEPCRFAPSALRVVSGVPQRTPAFRDGAFWIQDEASQLAASMFGGHAGPRVLDACAAPGGKTLLLSGRNGVGLAVAADRNVKRLHRLRTNLERVGRANVALVAADMSKPAPLAAAFDDVLVDAPCSGTGTLRRHPEIRWRLTPEDLPRLASTQRAILGSASALVRPGGRLVYSVCSLEPEEGEDVVSAFLDERPEFERADPGPALSEPARALVGPDGAVRTDPTLDGMDGFFAALLTRRRG